MMDYLSPTIKERTENLPDGISTFLDYDIIQDCRILKTILVKHVDSDYTIKVSLPTDIDDQERACILGETILFCVHCANRHEQRL
jgi:hypothetical protein